MIPSLMDTSRAWIMQLCIKMCFCIISRIFFQDLDTHLQVWMPVLS